MSQPDMITGSEFIRDRERRVASIAKPSVQATLEWTEHWHKYLVEPPCAVVSDLVYLPLCKYAPYGGEFSNYVEIDSDFSLASMTPRAGHPFSSKDWMVAISEGLPSNTMIHNQPFLNTNFDLPSVGDVCEVATDKGPVKVTYSSDHFYSDLDWYSHLKYACNHKQRGRIRNSLKRLNKKYDSKVHPLTIHHLEMVKEMQLERFGAGAYRFEKSAVPDVDALVAALLDRGCSYEVSALVVTDKVSHEIAAVVILLGNEHSLTMFMSGTRHKRHKAVNGYITQACFAVADGRRIEPLSYDNGWKKSWGFYSKPCFSFFKGVEPMTQLTAPTDNKDLL